MVPPSYNQDGKASANGVRETVERSALGRRVEDRKGAFGCSKAVVG